MSRYLRAVAHVHSDWSYDGSWPLERLAGAFRRRRFGAVLLTEHDRGFDDDRWDRYRHACREASLPKLVLVPGIEYSDPENRIHVLTWGLDAFLGEALPTSELMRQVGERGGVAVLAHPLRREALNAWEDSWSEALAGIEVWSRKYDGWAPGTTARALTGSLAGAAPYVGLDFHTSRQFFPLAMRLELHGLPTETTILAALRGGHATPRAVGLQALTLSRGPIGATLRGVEAVRRPIYRRARVLSFRGVRRRSGR